MIKKPNPFETSISQWEIQNSKPIDVLNCFLNEMVDQIPHKKVTILEKIKNLISDVIWDNPNKNSDKIDMYFQKYFGVLFSFVVWDDLANKKRLDILYNIISLEVSNWSIDVLRDFYFWVEYFKNKWDFDKSKIYKSLIIKVYCDYFRTPESNSYLDFQDFLKAS